MDQIAYDLLGTEYKI